MKVLVTGSSSHLASVLLPLLSELPQISQIRGIDLKPGTFNHPKFIENIIDIRDSKVSQLLEGYDTVIHLAFIVLRSSLKSQRKNRKLIHDINVNGSINIFQRAAGKNVKKIIHVSSAVVYGAWPDNLEKIRETQARKVMKGFSYAEDKNAVEDWLDTFEETNTVNVIRLRPHVILGPKSQPFLISLIKQPFYPKLPAPQPLSQCVWEDDVADAIISALILNAQGAFNLAAEPAISFKEMIGLTHKISIPLPIKLLSFIHRNLWKISGAGEEPGWLSGMPYSLAVDSSKAARELNWQPKYTTKQCIQMLKN
ncbi:MAG: NAD-dependent epimerase/dehydratase family protein [Gammaproteobacteria bacterium]|nr:NAD-dependent epimerase/dehydratase family protein [Gammaproteobacteria bacterium]